MADVRQPLATQAELDTESGLRASGDDALVDLVALEAAARAAADDLRALLTDPRFTDARPPTGGAGGVLSGGYPDPGFAVDMAEQSELQTEITNRAADVDAEEAARIAADALKANDADVVKLTGNQTVAGVKTFSSAPVVPTDSFPESATTGLVADLAAKETPVGAQSKVDAAIAALLDSAPGALDTLNELAAALGDDPNFATTLTNALVLKAPIASPTFTGTVTLPGDPGTALVATPKQYVDAAAAAAQAASQPVDADLGVIAALTPTNDDLMQRKAGAWANRTPAQVKTDLSLVKADVGLGNVDNTSDVNKPVSTAQQAALDLKQPSDSDLTAIAALSTTAYGRAILELANQAALHTLIGAPPFVRTDQANTFTRAFTQSLGGLAADGDVVAGWGGIWGTAVGALSSTNFGLLIADDGVEAIINGSSFVSLKVQNQTKIRGSVTGVGLNGNTPVAKAAAITTPTAPSAVYIQAEAQAMKTAVDAIRVALTNIGITL